MDKKYTFDEFTKLILQDFIAYFSKYNESRNQLFSKLSTHSGKEEFSAEHWMDYFKWYIKEFGYHTVADIQLKLKND